MGIISGLPAGMSGTCGTSALPGGVGGNSVGVAGISGASVGGISVGAAVGISVGGIVGLPVGGNVGGLGASGGDGDLLYTLISAIDP